MIPSRGDIELSFYERFLIARDIEPYPVQESAFERIFAGENVLVTVPTGTGKTLIAKAAIHKALACGQTAIYTTPLRALTEEKFRELCEDFGEERVGFATGDYKVRPEAYQATAKLLQLKPAEILMVACHNFDLDAARREGFRTCFVRRPDEWGPQGPPDPNPNPACTVVVDGFAELAGRLGA